MAMFKYVRRVKKPQSFQEEVLCLPDPNVCPDNISREDTAAMNNSILKHFETSSTVIVNDKVTKRGVKRKAANNFYSPEIRAKIGKYATEHGNTSAARKFSKELNLKIGESAVRVMKKQFIQTSKTQKDIPTVLTPEKRGKPLLLDDLDSVIGEHVTKIRDAGGIVNQNIVIATARGLVQQRNRSLLRENGGHIDIGRSWAISFLNRLGYVKRKGTKAARKIPTDFESQKVKFLSMICDIVKANRIPSELIINFDQTGLKIIPTAKWSMAPQGAKQVDIIGHEDKREITTVLGSTLSGDLLPPQLLYAGKTDACHPKFTFPSEWDISHTENHWSNEGSMLQYVQNVIVPYTEQVKDNLGLPLGQKALLIFDVFAAHRCDSFLNFLKTSRMEYMFVAAGCTGELQPMDLSVNYDFKLAMKNEFMSWYANEIARKPDEYVNMKLSVMKPLHAKWILSAFDNIKHNKKIILNGWRKAGILNSVIAID